MSVAVEIAFAARNALGESPVWRVDEQALYWVDMREPAVHRLDPSTGVHRSWAMPDLCPGVGLARDGLIVALGREIRRLDPASGTLHPLIEIEPAALGNRLNEMRCDRQGRIWTGSMRDFAAAVTGSLYRIAPPRATRLLADIRIPNSLGWSPDGRTMYFADTGDGCIRAYPFDPDTGGIGDMRVLLAADALPGKPDGCAIDAEGCLWTARYGGGLVARIAPDGRIDRAVPLPISQPTACAFGGADLKTLYITTARQRLSEDALTKEPHAGSLLALRCEVGGLPEPVFAG